MRVRIYPPIRMCVNEIEDRIKRKLQILQLLTTQTMKLLGSTKSENNLR